VSGSHHIMRHPDGRRANVPVHGNRPLPTGTLGSICRDVGRTADQLRDLL
jgi:predicted RNA binding protein YcfA (HicA-like mRNA interferase family)